VGAPLQLPTSARSTVPGAASDAAGNAVSGAPCHITRSALGTGNGIALGAADAVRVTRFFKPIAEVNTNSTNKMTPRHLIDSPLSQNVTYGAKSILWGCAKLGNFEGMCPKSTHTPLPRLGCSLSSFFRTEHMPNGSRTSTGLTYYGGRQRIERRGGEARKEPKPQEGFVRLRIPARKSGRRNFRASKNAGCFAQNDDVLASGNLEEGVILSGVPGSCFPIHRALG